MRNLMEPDPDVQGPSIARAFWLVALVLGFVLLLALAR